MLSWICTGPTVAHKRDGLKVMEYNGSGNRRNHITIATLALLFPFFPPIATLTLSMPAFIVNENVPGLDVLVSFNDREYVWEVCMTVQIPENRFVCELETSWLKVRLSVELLRLFTDSHDTPPVKLRSGHTQDKAGTCK